MSHFIYPSINNVGQFEGFDCNELQEEQLTSWNNIRGLSNSPGFVYSGGTITDGGSLSINISAVTVMIEGFVAGSTGSENLDGMADDDTNYIYLQIVKSGGLATDFLFLSNTTGVAPSDSVLIGRAIFSGGSFDSAILVEAASSGPVIGEYTGDGNSNRDITVGFQPKLVIIVGSGATPVWSINAFGRSTTLGLGIGFYGPTGGVSTLNKYVPLITTTGFQVSADGSNISLNNSAHGYAYYAQP